MRVNTDELARQAEELRSVANRLNDIQDTVLWITRNLSQETVGEKFQPKLLSAARTIGERCDELRRLRMALNQIAQLYEQCEMNVVDEADHSTVHHSHAAIQWINLPQFGPRPDAPTHEVFLRQGVAGIDWVPFDV